MNDTYEKAQSKKTIRAEIIADRMQKVVKAFPKVPSPLKIKRDSKIDKKQSEEMGLMLSDMHIGSSFTFQETGGLAEFNLGVAKRRINNLTKATIDIYDLHSKLYDIPTLNIFSLGDIVAGANGVGAWSSSYMDMSVIDQMTEGFQMISGMIYEFLKVFETIEFWGIAGNHGRVARTGIQKQFCNWDYICHKFIQARFKDNPRVKFNLPKTWWQMAKIKNH